MPEIWLRYGTTDVVLDIKFENLASQISANFQLLPEDEIRTKIAEVPLTNNMLILALSGSKAAGKTVAMLGEQARAKGFEFTVDVPKRAASALRSSMEEKDLVTVNRIDYGSLQDRLSKFQNTIIISSVSYDPLFGFAGAPTALVRCLFPESMAEAFKARKNDRPIPGTIGEPLKVVTSAVAGIPATSIELVASSDGIVGIHTGSMNETFDKAVSQFQSISTIDVDPVKCAVISASSEVGAHLTLADSLNSLWNSVHAVKEGGSAILLAENREGLGGGALQMFVDGLLKPEHLLQSPYVDGLEHLLFLEELRQNYELGLVSTLPHYYAQTKLGFSTYASVKDIIDKLPEKHGKNFKVLVMSDADILLLKPKA